MVVETKKVGGSYGDVTVIRRKRWPATPII